MELFLPDMPGRTGDTGAGAPEITVIDRYQRRR
jgi:hypothetical protein